MVEQILHLSDQTVDLKRNEFLKVKGSVDTNVYYVECGSVRVYITDGCEECTIRFGYADNLIVALDSFLTGKPSALIIQAIKKTTVRIISKTSIDGLMQTAEHQSLWTSILEDLVLQQHEREVDLLTRSPKERYRRVLERSPRLFQEIPNRHIANYLRMSPETLSRLKARFLKS